MKLLYTFLILFLSTVSTSHSQLISKFNWDSSPVSESQFGPNAISVSGSAVSSPNGAGGTNGLNAGLPKEDIEFVLPAAAFMNIGGIDFQIDFQRDESRGDFITCGTNFAFGIESGDLYIKFVVEDEFGGTQIVEINNIYAVPDDDVFRTYRFYYLPNTGYAEILVDGTSLWNYYIGNPSNLVWSNNNVVIGGLMDGNGFNRTVFDNVVIGEVYDSALPVKLSLFEVEKVGDEVLVRWFTESELNNHYFTVERSLDGEEFSSIAKVKGAGTTNQPQSYFYTDDEPVFGISYYRITQTDLNGKSNSTETRSVQLKPKSKGDIFVFPNLLSPETEFQIRLPYVGESIEIVIINERGLNIKEMMFGNNDHLKMSAPSSSGIYFLSVNIDGATYAAKKIVVR